MPDAHSITSLSPQAPLLGCATLGQNLVVPNDDGTAADAQLSSGNFGTYDPWGPGV